jgi:periplasmic divalent cation tolerance protein
VSPYPLEPPEARGPMRWVVTTYPSPDAAARAVDAVLARRLAACANRLSIASRYWWKGQVESADEVLVLFKTVPKRVGGLFRFLKETHPYTVPEILELDVPRVDPEYLRYLVATLDPAGGPPRYGERPRRPAARRGRGARAPGRTRGPHRRPSR